MQHGHTGQPCSPRAVVDAPRNLWVRSSGVNFLQRALGLTFFPELWDVRTELDQQA